MARALDGSKGLGPGEMQRVFDALGLQVFERGWLSSNNVLFYSREGSPSTVVDTGYATHSAQTVALLESALGDAPLDRIVNTHLHSDHCGGNAALQARWKCSTWVPHDCFDAVQAWDQSRLSFEATDQRCDRFAADKALAPGDELWLGAHRWEVHAAPGHDPTALMFFEPHHAVLISGDALWERRLAIVFPELVGEVGFDACWETLDCIERLAPSVVIPGHGAPFSDVGGALGASRERLRAFRQDPERHRQHAVRALAMFHMFEVGSCSREELIQWLRRTPITGNVALAHNNLDWAEIAVKKLQRDGVLSFDGTRLYFG